MNNFKNIALFGLIILSFTGYSQNIINIAVNEFTSNKKTKYVTAVTNRVIEIMHKNSNINVLDRTELSEIMKEHYIQAGEEFMDSEITVEQGKLLKTKYLLNGNIEVIQIMRKRGASGSILGYFCVVSFTIKIFDIESGILKSTKYFESKREKGMTPETSILASLSSIEKKIIKYFEKQLI